ncbi:MAG: aminopeptidase P family protein [Candidatus Zixiibacteriota bacterium]|nr:MAG: aminopeptidase P family protein [candidate division Zixibacteria bacterium]
MSKKRIDGLRKKMKAENLDGLIVTYLDHVRYLSGFTGSAGLLVISGGRAEFFTDFRYKDQAAKEVTGARINIIKRLPTAALKDFPHLNVRNRKYGFNGEYLTITDRKRLQESLPDAILVSCDGIFTELGWVKEPPEVANISQAVKIGDAAFERVLPLVRPGARESEIAAELEYQMKMMGSEKPAFETIIASGYRSALPHGVASLKKVQKGDLVTFDFGATVGGYVSDLTRTVVVGKATARQKKVYEVVLRANKAGIRKVRPGVSGKAVDRACRTVITRAGYGKKFGHGTGHGIGFFVHVGPRLSTVSDDKLMINNVITIEPGIYFSGWGGVRIEDDVQVTRGGCKVLTRAPKNLLEL